MKFGRSKEYVGRWYVSRKHCKYYGDSLFQAWLNWFRHEVWWM